MIGGYITLAYSYVSKEAVYEGYVEHTIVEGRQVIS